MDNLNQINFHPKQLMNRLNLDMNNNFQDGTIYLGRYKYPEGNKS